MFKRERRQTAGPSTPKPREIPPIKAAVAREQPIGRAGPGSGAWPRMADELAEHGLIEYVENPTHRCAKLARLTATGKKLMDEAMTAELKLAGRLARNFGKQAVEIARDVIRRLTRILTDERLAARLLDPR